MEEFLIATGLILLIVVILFGLPFLLAINLAAIFGWSLWNTYWVVFAMFIMFGGSSGAAVRSMKK